MSEPAGEEASLRPGDAPGEQPRLDSEHNKTVVGNSKNFWAWSSQEGWDLTHPPSPDSHPTEPRISLDCEISNVVIDPIKTALLIIDMQNISLSSALSPAPPARAAEKALLEYAIPAARKMGIQIIWLNWGLTEEELESVTPAEIRTFGFRANSNERDYGLSERKGDRTEPSKFLDCGERPQLRSSLGDDIGLIKLEDGSEVEGGRKMMRGTWNARLHDPLLVAFEEGQQADRPDVLIHKNKNSGLGETTSPCNVYLQRTGLRTLLFSGVNTDQCVVATLQDAHARGFDTIMLKDGCATDSPAYTQEAAEYNMCRNWGFLSSCKALAKAAHMAKEVPA
jgi:nicotinamidase-related amidase